MVTNSIFKESTDILVEKTICMKNSMCEGTSAIQDFRDMKDFVEKHFDELSLSPLLQSIRQFNCEYEFNAYMALLNKYLGMSKGLIPFQLNMKDFLNADKIMETLGKTY